MTRTARRPRSCWGFRNTREEGVAMKTKFTSILLGLFLCLLVIGTGWSQETTAAINGQVNDASAAAAGGQLRAPRGGTRFSDGHSALGPLGAQSNRQDRLSVAGRPGQPDLG